MCILHWQNLSGKIHAAAENMHCIQNWKDYGTEKYRLKGNIKYRNIENCNDRKNVIIYNHYSFLSLKKGDYFGDLALESDDLKR